ncbi:MAG: OsmC family protein [Chitinophagaceae bacterium]|nr:OsmC family protein [Chitinophagaceae bacterium]
MSKQHYYKTHLTWTGNKGEGTKTYGGYSRNYVISIPQKPEIPGSSDPSFRGDPARYNPEELLIASLSSCHMLWFLHLCAAAGIVVTAYEDRATGIMHENANGSGHFTQVTLHPLILINSEINIEKLQMLHEEANRKCFIANSCNFPILHEPTYNTSG